MFPSLSTNIPHVWVLEEGSECLCRLTYFLFFLKRISLPLPLHTHLHHILSLDTLNFLLSSCLPTLKAGWDSLLAVMMSPFSFVFALLSLTHGLSFSLVLYTLLDLAIMNGAGNAYFSSMLFLSFFLSYSLPRVNCLFPLFSPRGDLSFNIFLSICYISFSSFCHGRQGTSTSSCSTYSPLLIFLYGYTATLTLCLKSDWKRRMTGDHGSKN